MASRFHVNPVSGNTGVCKAFYDCPFGDEATAHFDTAAEARSFFEQSQSTFAPPKKKRDKVFRIGSLTPPERHFEDLAQVVKSFDEAVPEGRQGRAGAIFASPDLDSHMRWVLGARHSRDPVESHELAVDPNSVYVYPIDTYERASNAEHNNRMENFEELRKEYWESGMTLSDWKAWAATAKPKLGTWELLLSKEAIQSAKPVSNRRIIEAAPDKMAREINWALEPRRASKGLIWRKDKKTDDELEAL
jgi:hypothetical protein